MAKKMNIENKKIDFVIILKSKILFSKKNF